MVTSQFSTLGLPKERGDLQTSTFDLQEHVYTNYLRNEICNLITTLNKEQQYVFIEINGVILQAPPLPAL